MTEKNFSSGTSFTKLLTVAFIVLKLLNVIDWSWFWVISPLIALIILIIISTVITALLKFK